MTNMPLNVDAAMLNRRPGAPDGHQQLVSQQQMASNRQAMVEPTLAQAQAGAAESARAAQQELLGAYKQQIIGPELPPNTKAVQAMGPNRFYAVMRALTS